MGAKPPPMKGDWGAKPPSLEIPNSVTGSIMFFVLFPAFHFRFLMYKTGTARMPRQGMEVKICRAPKA